MARPASGAGNEISVDVWRHFGSAAKRFAIDGWYTYASLGFKFPGDTAVDDKKG